MRLYKLADAAAYLGLSEVTVRYHIYVAGDLKPDVDGKSLVFTQATLDEFRKRKRPAHRPKKSD